MTRSHIFFCRDSVQCSCRRAVARLFFRASSISARGSGGGEGEGGGGEEERVILLDVVSENISSFFWTLCLKTFHLGTVCVCLA